MQEVKVTKIVFLLVFIMIGLWFLYIVSDILVPFVISGILAYVLSPLITRLQSYGIKRTIAVVILFALFLLTSAGVIMSIIPRVANEAAGLKRNLPNHVRKTQYILFDFQRRIENRFPIIRRKGLVESGTRKVLQFLEKEISEIPSYILQIFSLFSLFILIPFVTFFLLLGGRDTVDRFFDIIPSRHVETVLGLISEADEILGKYIRGQITESAVVGILTIIGLLILNIDYAIIIGIVAGLLNMIPYAGPVVGAIPAILVGFLKYQSITMIIGIIIVFAIVQFIDNNVLKPLIVSKGVKLGPVAMIFSIMAGAKIYGILGMLIAIPMACIIKVTFGIILGKYSSQV
ncbi:MAG: AI-2E family transporter [Endomicrobiales bacterium]|nr:AI-2E family transporter [Endomicrobiales bacterium]